MTTILDDVSSAECILIALAALAVAAVSMRALYMRLAVPPAIDNAEAPNSSRRPKMFFLRGASIGAAILVLVWAVNQGFGGSAASLAALAICAAAMVQAYFGAARTMVGLSVSFQENARASVAMIVAAFAYFWGWMLWILAPGVPWPLPITLAVVFWVGLALSVWADRRGRRLHAAALAEQEEDR